MHATAMPTRPEVAIVGAGPTGLALAVTLASAGIDYVIVDRLAEGANTSRAAVVHARTLEVLEELGAAMDRSRAAFQSPDSPSATAPADCSPSRSTDCPRPTRTP